MAHTKMSSIMSVLVHALNLRSPADARVDFQPRFPSSPSSAAAPFQTFVFPHHPSPSSAAISTFPSASSSISHHVSHITFFKAPLFTHQPRFHSSASLCLIFALRFLITLHNLLQVKYLQENHDVMVCMRTNTCNPSYVCMYDAICLSGGAYKRRGKDLKLNLGVISIIA